jgi:hypothetical protein
MGDSNSSTGPDNSPLSGLRVVAELETDPGRQRCRAASGGGMDWYIRNLSNRPVTVTYDYWVQYPDLSKSNEARSIETIAVGERKYIGCINARTFGQRSGETQYRIVSAK